MDQMLAYCGLDCTVCPAYQATQANDMSALEAVAAQWRTAFNLPDLQAESILCDGCLTTNGRLSGYCRTCQIRACALEHAVDNCAGCTEYICEKLNGFFTHAPEAKQRLDAVRMAQSV